MTRVTQQPAANDAGVSKPSPARVAAALRIKSQDLFQSLREIEIEHEGRIYRLRMTQLNKLILTA